MTGSKTPKDLPCQLHPKGPVWHKFLSWCLIQCLFYSFKRLLCLQRAPPTQGKWGKRQWKRKERGEVTVPASEDAFDLSPLCWSRVKRHPEARRTSHTFTLLSALRRKMRPLIQLYTLLVNNCKYIPIKWGYVWLSYSVPYRDLQVQYMLKLMHCFIYSSVCKPVFVFKGQFSVGD